MTKISKTVMGLKCPLCKDRFYSHHRHDMHFCKCGYCWVDGGSDYSRWGYGVHIEGNPVQSELLTKLVGQPLPARVKREPSVKRESNV